MTRKTKKSNNVLVTLISNWQKKGTVEKKTILTKKNEQKKRYCRAKRALIDKEAIKLQQAAYLVASKK